MPLNIKYIRAWVESCESQAAAARMLQMKPPHLSRLLSGESTDIRLSTLEHFCNVMRCEPIDLIRRAKIV
jgi:DNA-binding Xre family transcriptional regulator